MVDVSAKSPSKREASASAFVLIKSAVLKALPKNPKGDPLEVARLAGIMAAKRTSELIPMCHPLPLSHVDVTLRLCENGVAITSRVTTTAVTGVEMEAMVAASVAACSNTNPEARAATTPASARRPRLVCRIASKFCWWMTIP